MQRVVVAMSGGVDSSVAAALLAESGHEVVGLFMRTGVSAGGADGPARRGCCGLEDAHDARRVADRLGIPFYALDLRRDFDRLVEGFLDEYEAGRTPNPCILCNRDFKFGRLLAVADDLGAEGVATGHYARIVSRAGRLAVARSADAEKDQSYVLFPLAQEQLARARFPLGGFRKADVRRIARERGLPVFDKPDSQDICFVPGGDYARLFAERRPGSLREGPLVDRAGVVIGTHGGHQLYTIGQRRGTGGGAPAPRYVLGLDPAANAVVVGGEEDLYRSRFSLDGVVWGGMAPPSAGGSFEADVRIRHRHTPRRATVVALRDGTLDVAFHEPERAITPGQAAVLYDDDGAILAGGWIR